MRKLTLLGFLSEYVRSLSERNTLNIHKLIDEVYSGNDRLREPLFMYCFYSNKTDILMKYLTESDKAEYIKNTELLKKGHTNKLPENYMKVLNSYKCKAGMKANDDHIKELMIERIVKLKEQKNISNYRIYTDLKINAGNFNDFIKNRNLNKLSLNKSRDVFNYLQSL